MRKVGDFPQVNPPQGLIRIRPLLKNFLRNKIFFHPAWKRGAAYTPLPLLSIEGRTPPYAKNGRLGQNLFCPLHRGLIKLINFL
jgi:hypothetical protein